MLLPLASARKSHTTPFWLEHRCVDLEAGRPFGSVPPGITRLGCSTGDRVAKRVLRISISVGQGPLPDGHW